MALYGYVVFFVIIFVAKMPVSLTGIFATASATKKTYYTVFQKKKHPLILLAIS